MLIYLRLTETVEIIIEYCYCYYIPYLGQNFLTQSGKCYHFVLKSNIQQNCFLLKFSFIITVLWARDSICCNLRTFSGINIFAVLETIWNSVMNWFCITLKFHQCHNALACKDWAWKIHFKRVTLLKWLSAVRKLRALY